MTTLSELRRKRGSYKSKLKHFTTYLNSILVHDKPNKTQISELTLRLSTIEAWYGDYDTLQLEIEGFMEISDADCEKEYEYREKFEIEYFASVSKAREYVSRFTSVQPGDPALSASSDCGTACTSGGLSLKLPTIHLPTFSGRYDTWLEFHDTYVSLIHSNDSIPKINKFHYLRSSLKDSAANVINSLDFSSKNYEVAWKLLCERYHNDKVLISSHIQTILDIESISKESSPALRNLIDTINKNIRSLQTLNVDTKNWDILIIHIVSNKLDNTTNRKWKEYLNTYDNLPELDTFIKFIKNRAELLESLNQTTTKRRHSEPVIRSRTFVVNTDTQHSLPPYTCHYCKQNHAIYQCPKFKSLSVHARIHKSKQMRLCLNCLRKGHEAQRCKLGPCRICSKWHNTLIHTDEPPQTTPQQLSAATSTAEDGQCVMLAAQDDANSDTQSLHEQTVPHDIALSTTHNSYVLLSTVLIKVADINGKQHTVRALLDNGSTSNFITEKLRKTLNLTLQSATVTVEGISRESINISKRCTVTISSRIEEFTTNINCFVIPHITQTLPTTYFDIKSLNVPNHLVLADPTFNTPSEVDMLLSADLFWTTLGNERISLGKNMPVLNSSKFGWLISGSMYTQQKAKNNTVQCTFLNEVELKNQLDRFFELESVPAMRNTTKQESICEQHFLKTTTRLNDGRFVVQIPLKQSAESLGDSYEEAYQRFLSLERKFKRYPSLKQEYEKFIQEYINLNHMSLNKNTSNEGRSYMLPHHGVLKDSSLTTKLRVVFDASAKTTSGLSFNDIQHIGPTVQDNLISILIRFRQHKYVVTSDCEKMYRCVLVAEHQRCLQQILWRFHPSQELKVYKLNTVTYGTASAPYLATRCLVQLGQECTDPLVREIILKDFYVDDFISGHESKYMLLKIIEGVISQLKSGKFNLRKWRSNCPDILQNIQDGDNNDTLLKLVNDDDATTLGLRWSCQTDLLQFSLNTDPLKHNTLRSSKRTVLSTIGQVFDPLGFVNPCILQGKIILQKLWALRVPWDNPLPPELEKDWILFLKSIPYLNTITVPRHMVCNSPIYIELHSFSDASLHAYSACVYLRSISIDGSTTVNLVMAKSKVAPLKGMTIPRLELSGALLGVRLAIKVETSLRLNINRSVFWCDSTIVLGWIRAPKSSLKAFVLNRINEISEHTDPEAWRYVPSNLNPADIGSRGCNAIKLQESSLWFCGPGFLLNSETQWPNGPQHIPTILPETKIDCKFATQKINFTHKYSNYSKLQHVTAYMLRFIHNCQQPNNKRFAHLTVSELTSATLILCRIVQLDLFSEEYNILRENKELPIKTRILNLNPFMSNENVIRVGGRLSNSNYDYDTKHPILLHASHHVSKLLLIHYHRIFLHSGPQLILSLLRTKFWVVGGRNLARKVTHECHTCCRFAGRTIQPIMANLPKERLHSDFPFCNTAVDYAGPILIADRKGRGCRLIKSYICVFVCLTVRAVHIELVTDLTTEAFIAALNRFIARRGKPTNLYSDNGSNFIGAYNELSKFLKTKCSDVSAYAAEQAITFKFSPAYSPHFNGLAESSVKSIKYHLKRVLALAHLTYEEMNTVLIQIEGILNSRPLTPLSSDPNDLIPLTPSHFLIGRTITMLPNSKVDADKPGQICILPRYQRVQALASHFWNRYQVEYISELQKRFKWQRPGGELHVGDLVVVKDDRLPPNRWLLGRISKLNPGCDGIARVADVTTSTGILRRAYNRLCVLPSSLSAETSLEHPVPTRGAC